MTCWNSDYVGGSYGTPNVENCCLNKLVWEGECESQEEGWENDIFISGLKTMLKQIQSNLYSLNGVMMIF